jgi:FkbM family methyltransferase
LKINQDLLSAVIFLKSGRKISDNLKILGLFTLSFFRNRSPNRIRGLFDLPVRGLLVETDVKFRIRTVFDFFVFSDVWERELKKVFQWKKGMKFLDIGAHIGRYTVRAGLNIGKEGKIVAIEPNTDNFKLLVENLRLNSLQNCIPLNIAAYSSDTQLSLYMGGDSAKNSVKEDSGKSCCTVQARALDQVLAEVGVDEVNLIKIDVEGAEYDVLKGLVNTLRKGSPMVVVEVLEHDTDRIIQYMHNLNYSESLLNFSPDYKGGIAYYCFKKYDKSLQIPKPNYD